MSLDMDALAEDFMLTAEDAVARALGPVLVRLATAEAQVQVLTAALEKTPHDVADAIKEWVTAKLAEIQPVRDGKDADMAEVQAAIKTAIGEIELPVVPDVIGIVRAAVEAMPAPKDWASEIDAVQSRIVEVSATIPAPAIEPDLSGFAMKSDLEALPMPKDWTPEIDKVSEAVAETLAALQVKLDAIAAQMDVAAGEVEERLARHPGTFPIARAWTDAVHYAGDVVTHEGALWQAGKDTGRAPPDADWTCLVARGEDGQGQPGRSFAVCGTYDAGSTYAALDVVALDGSAFVAKQDDPGDCPGEGWQLIACRGGKGKPGDNAKPANPPAMPLAFYVDDTGMLTLTFEDGRELKADLRKVAK